MAATHDTHNWDATAPVETDLQRRQRECRERGEALEAQANRKAWLEWKHQGNDR
jgi:hypothetical protein